MRKHKKPYIDSIYDLVLWLIDPLLWVIAWCQVKVENAKLKKDVIKNWWIMTGFDVQRFFVDIWCTFLEWIDEIKARLRNGKR